MLIRWLGHAAVEIVSESGLRILTDPFTPGWYGPPAGALYYEPIRESYDIVAVSHEHPDHNAVRAVRGNPEIVRGMQLRGKGLVNIRGIDFWSIGTYHDDKGGKLLGESSILCFEVDGVKVGHSGDLGHPLTQEQLEEIKRYGLDVFLLCIGLIEKEGERLEKYVIDTETKIMNEVYEALRSTIKFLIPIHFRNEKCDFRFVTVDEFCRGKPNVVVVKKTEAEFGPGMFRSAPEILVLEPAL